MNSNRPTPTRRRSSDRLTFLASVSALALGLGLAGTAEAGYSELFGASDDLSVLLVGYSDDSWYSGFGLVSASDYLGQEDGALNDGYATVDLGEVATPNSISAEMSEFLLSGDGTTVAGSYLESGKWTSFLWTEADGFTELGTLDGGTWSYAMAVSYDGSAVAGNAETADGSQHAYYWQSGDSSLTDLGTLPGETYSSVSAISGDGTTVVGYSDSHGFVWSLGDSAMTDIGSLGGSTLATLVSFDGDVVVGYSFTDSSYSAYHAIRWTEAGGLVDLGTFGGNWSSANAMSADGDVIVGQSYTASSYAHAFRWAVGSDGITGTMADLGTLGGTDSYAYDVSDDGSVVVGEATDASNVSHAFRWTEENGLISVDDWLRSNGVTLTEDVTLAATAVSSDGSTILGYTYDYELFIARVAGIITLEEYLSSVSNAGSIATAQPIGSADTIMFGAQGSPMRNLLSAGQKSVYGTVDSGYDDGASSDGGLLLGDFGFAYGLSDGMTLRVSAGGSYTDQDLDEGGDYQSKGWYISPEVSANVAGNLYLTVGGYYSRGKLDINRGYLNGTATDYSTGETDTETYAAKIRLDWLNAFTVEEVAFTPYAALSRTNSKTDAYSESGGSFPASYDAASDHATIARLGLDAIRPLTGTITLLARAEVAYRFEEETAGTSGEIIGLSSFDLEGQDVKQLWLRGGIGAEMAVAGGTASLMLNATTEGDDPDVWLRSGWKVDF
ncbi:autotransporter domain-containing protein [Rhizobium glycinendophyticum]|uniref:Autotransporter domain-containing protein n=1 Tax=Rhizobium glycinendophyticum TaxID=2589807 RepID=A0A504UAZ7_9HYPH|nr:autotransporter domain-containing protein [Rhizobium glycinendophyticum]TPP10460.1 autotransporter domain-containing protein [Rhizobium glycinendophyticum]